VTTVAKAPATSKKSSGKKKRDENKEVSSGVKDVLGKVSDFVKDPLEVPIGVLEKATEKLDKKMSDNRKKLFTKEFGTELLVINTRGTDYLDSKLEPIFGPGFESYDVYDESQIIKYRVEDTGYSKYKRFMNVYNVKGKLLGRVREKSSRRRYHIDVSKKGIGETIKLLSSTMTFKVNSKSRLGNKKLVVGFNGWHIEGNSRGSDYTVFKGSEVIAKISRIAGSYSLSFKDAPYELILLMLVIVISSTRIAKSTGVTIEEDSS